MDGVVKDVKAGAKVAFIIQVIVAFLLINLILSVFDMVPYLNKVSAFIRNPLGFIKALTSPPAAS